MSLLHINDREFIEKLTEIILVSMPDENFCVRELAKKSGMSATVINQRLEAINKKHLSQFIREVRLKKALELLQNGRYTAAEVAYQIGFSSPAYFNKCFHEFYGYPPGKIKNARVHDAAPNNRPQQLSESQEWIKWKKILQFVLLTALLLIISGAVAFNFYRKVHQNGVGGVESADDMRISIAVLPFRNLTNDGEWNIWQEGIQSCLINLLSNSIDLIVRSEESVNNILTSKGDASYTSLKPELAGDISQKLDARIFIYGNINKVGPTVRLNAQLIDSKNGETFSSFHIDGSAEKILEMIDSLSILINNSLELSALKKVEPAEIHDYNDYTTKSPEAYKYFIYGNLAYFKNDFPTAIDWYLQALVKDSTFYKPMAKLATAYYNENNYEQGKEWCRKYCSKKDLFNMRDRIAANALYALFYGNYYERIKYLRQLLDLDGQNPMIWFNIGDGYYEMMQYERAIPEFEKALELFDKSGTKPYWGAFYYELGICYHKTREYKKERKLYKRAERDFPGDPGLMDQQVWLELSVGNNEAADYYLYKWLSIRREEGWSEASIASYMGYIFLMADMPDKEEQCRRKSLALEPQRATRLNSLAYFLIDEERNIQEGLGLVEKALLLEPDNFNSMHIKGYALFKLGRYPEALDLMNKSWNLRIQKSIFHPRAFLQLEEARKAVAESYN